MRLLEKNIMVVIRSFPLLDLPVLPIYEKTE